MKWAKVGLGKGLFMNFYCYGVGHLIYRTLFLNRKTWFRNEVFKATTSAQTGWSSLTAIYRSACQMHCELKKGPFRINKGQKI